jgi:hypothetical protein
MSRIRIPFRFYQDHQERDLDTPVNYAKSKSYAIIDSEDPALPELISDASFYANQEMCGELWESCRGIVLSARATLKAIRKEVRE